MTQPPAPSGARIRAGSIVRPDTVEVGDPFTFVVTVAVPQNATVQWGAITDTTAVVVMQGPVRVVDEGTKVGTRRERAEYTLTAWDVGALPLNVPDATVRIGNQSLTVPLNDARVVVRSVLPGDTTLHVPKPAQALFQREVPWWEQWWPALIVLLALGLLAWLWRRRKRAVPVRTVAPPPDPYDRARHEFDRLDRLALAESGECGRFVALAVDVLRLYLAARVPHAALSLTSEELLPVVAEDARVPRDRLWSLLVDADAVKFAARPVSSERAHALAREARAVVEAIETAERARRAQEAAEREARLEAVRKERAEAEEAARRASRRPKAGTGA